MDYPVLKPLGSLAPDTEIIKKVRDPRFKWGDFTYDIPLPAALEEFAKSHGYEFDDETGRGLLFASKNSVNMHKDEKPAIIWVLRTKLTCNGHIEFVTCNGYVQLKTGDVYIADTRLPHGVICIDRSEYILVSIYCRKAAESLC